MPLNEAVKATKKTIEITDDFRKAFDILEHSTTNLFITGKAGTGKSTFLEYLRKKTGKKTAVVAPTGVSALNVRGQTIHSFFSFKPAFIAPGTVKTDLDPKRIFEKIELLIIDEISMVRADIFDAIENYLRLNGPKKGQPFGGVQLCVIGDLFQLPPIVTRDEQDIFSQYFQSPFFFSAQAYRVAAFNIMELDYIFRQSDQEFITALNRLRIGHTHDEVVRYINQRHTHQETNTNNTVTLTTTNNVADTINQQKIAKISTSPFSYYGKVDGDFDLNKGRLPTPEKLVLKKGAQVMFVRNDTQKRWVNGTIGVVTRLSSLSIDVEIIKNGRKRSYSIDKETWDSISYQYDEETEAISTKVTGSYTQYPLILAWAITIHKSQGKTLDSAVIDLGTGAFASGQLYVALSRCRSFNDITLKKPISKRDIRSDRRVLDFYDYVFAQ